MVMAQTAGSYLSIYLIKDTGIIPQNIMLTVLTVAIGVGMLPAMVLLPVLRKRFSLKQIYIGSAFLGAIVTAALWFVGYSNVWLLLFFLVLYGLPLGVFNVITYALVADAVDYNEWKTGKRTEGVCFAAQTLISKANAGISTFVVGVTLKLIDFKSPIEEEIGGKLVTTYFYDQGAAVNNGLFAMLTIIPCIGFLLAAIPMFFNTYTGKKKEKIQAELALSRAKRDDACGSEVNI